MAEQNAELRLKFADGETLTEEERARAEVLVARSKRKREKKERLKGMREKKWKEKLEKKLKAGGGAGAIAASVGKMESDVVPPSGVAGTTISPTKERMRSPEAMARRVAKRKAYEEQQEQQ